MTLLARYVKLLAMDKTTPVHPVARLRQPEGGEFLLYPGRMVRVGRSSENDVVLNDPKISRFHAELDWTGSGFAIRDLGSINGTRVNHESVLGSNSRTLRDGDEIRINQRVLIFEIVRADSSEPITEPRSLGATGGLRRRGPYLVVTEGPDTGSEFPLWGEKVTIGRASRDANAEIRLTDEAISRSHACLELHDDGYYLLDLININGTRLNGERFEDAIRVQDGDQIQLGQTCLVFHHHKPVTVG